MRPLPSHRSFVHANSRLAEHLCWLHLTELTVERARQLQHLHADHRPDDCPVHLAAMTRLIDEGAR